MADFTPVKIDAANGVTRRAETGDTVPVANGGLGLAAVSSGGLPYGSASNVYSVLAAGTAGQVLTMSGGFPSWAAPTGGAGAAAFLQRTTNYTVPNGTTTAIPFDAESVDTAGGHSTSVNTSRYTIQSGFDGTYALIFQSPQTPTTGGYMIFEALVNGTVVSAATQRHLCNAAGNSEFQGEVFQAILTGLVAGDYIEVSVQGVGWTGTLPSDTNYYPISLMIWKVV